MLQNRVDPWGNIIKTNARGDWMGNRGVIHNDKQQIVRPFKHKNWIICLLEFKGRKRKVMTPGLWTELFFMDEATAFSAGHRPCAECRRLDYNRFKTAWIKGNPQYGFHEKTSIREIDEIIHQERMTGIASSYKLSHLPDGVFVIWNDEPHLLANKQLFRWTPSGYEKGISLPEIKKIKVLTPRSVVHAFKAGYQPQMRQ